MQYCYTNLTFMGPCILIYFYSKINQMHNFRVYWISLYMFRTVFPSIIRTSKVYIQHQVYVIQDIYLMLCVQSWTPNDGQKDRPKHVDWFSINSKIVHLIGFTIEILLHESRLYFFATETSNNKSYIYLM